MAQPTSRQELKEYALRALGHPVIEVNVTDEQLEDRIDEALLAYLDGHMDGSYHGYVIINITEQDIASQSVTLPEHVCDVIKISSLESTSNYDNLFDLNYHLGQMMAGALLNSSALDTDKQGGSTMASMDGLMTNYTIVSGYFQDLQNMLDTKPIFNYNRNRDKIILQMDWSTVKPGAKIVLEVSMYIDPNVDIDVWNDSWLKAYTIALFQLQWGRNLQLFSQYQLPGGMVLDGEKIMNTAIERAVELKETLNKTYAKPLGFMVG
jgi:hypothetical protein